MKKIGIIGAMELEVEELKSQMEEVCVKEKASMEFYQGTLWKRSCRSTFRNR